MTFGYKPHPTSILKMGDRKKARHAVFAYNRTVGKLNREERKKARQAKQEALLPKTEVANGTEDQST